MRDNMKFEILKGKELNPRWKGYVVIQNYGKNVGRILVEELTKKQALEMQVIAEQKTKGELKKELGIE
jgi:hypothetical protein